MRSNKEHIDSMSENGSGQEHSKWEWTVEKEMLLVEWADMAKCYKWMTLKAHKKYTKLHKFFTIPTIVLSTLTGTASFALSGLPSNATIYAPYIIGSTTIFIGILSTIQQFLKISELKESFLISAILWDKYARNISIELSKEPLERMNSKNFMKVTRVNFDHLMESTPPIPQNIVLLFKKKFMGKEGSEQRTIYNALKKPDILDFIVSTDINRHQWYKSKLLVEDEKQNDGSDENRALDISIFNSTFNSNSKV
jgi:hypothetical protein